MESPSHLTQIPYSPALAPYLPDFSRLNLYTFYPEDDLILCGTTMRCLANNWEIMKWLTSSSAQ